MCSADYHVNNMVSPVLFQEALDKIPRNALMIEIAPHCLLQAILKRSVGPKALSIGLMKRSHENNVQFLLSSLGRLVLFFCVQIYGYDILTCLSISEIY